MTTLHHPLIYSRQMVQGQTAQKFFAFDEGDVWRHPGHSRQSLQEKCQSFYPSFHRELPTGFDLSACVECMGSFADSTLTIDRSVTTSTVDSRTDGRTRTDPIWPNGEIGYRSHVHVRTWVDTYPASASLSSHGMASIEDLSM